MRIIAGKFRRRQLKINPGSTTRPITDRAKVILFDRLDPYLSDAKVLDLYSGTGSLGLEALSRGAVKLVCIESDPRAFTLLKENVESLKVDEEVLCWKTDALYSSYKPRFKEGWYPYDLVFFDPPFRMLERLDPDSAIAASLSRLATPEVTSPDAHLILRSGKFADFVLPAWPIVDQELVIGSMKIFFLRKSREKSLFDSA